MNGVTAVAGSVSSSANTATFTPSAALAYGVTYIASLSIGVTDLAGNALNDVYFWSFTTCGQPGDDPPVSINPSAANVTRGGAYTATIAIGAVTNFNAYQFDLTYNDSVIQVSGDEGGSAVSNGLIGSQTVPLAMWGFVPSGQPGSIRVLGHLPGVSSATGQGYLARIQFEVTGAAGQSCQLTLSNVALYNSAGDIIPSSPAGGVVNVVAVPLEMLTASLVDGLAGSNYSLALMAAGGQSPYSWSAGGLPSGLTLSSSGTISGQPSVSGSFNVTVTLTDSFSPANTLTRILTLQVYPALQITTSSLADGSTAFVYSATLAATGGKGAYSWSASGLPSGLTLSSAGVISGQSSLAVNSIVTFTVTDSFSPPYSASKTISLKILLKGDANGDGGITMGDVTKVERIILGLDSPTLSADADGDGQVNMGDVTRIERLILGI